MNILDVSNIKSLTLVNPNISISDAVTLLTNTTLEELDLSDHFPRRYARFFAVGIAYSHKHQVNLANRARYE